jgi:hypothetical protein
MEDWRLLSLQAVLQMQMPFVIVTGAAAEAT